MLAIQIDAGSFDAFQFGNCIGRVQCSHFKKSEFGISVALTVDIALLGGCDDRADPVNQNLGAVSAAVVALAGQARLLVQLQPAIVFDQLRYAADFRCVAGCVRCCELLVEPVVSLNDGA